MGRRNNKLPSGCISAPNPWEWIHNVLYADLPTIPPDFPRELIPGGGSAKLRLRLWLHQRELCFWCRRPTRLRSRWDDLNSHPPDEATLDHMYSKYEPQRKQHATAFVMACAACNHQRGKDAEQRVSKEELRRRAGYYSEASVKRRISCASRIPVVTPLQTIESES